MDTVAPLPRPVVIRWRVALVVVFVVNGFAVNSWVSRVPAAQEILGVGIGQVGLLLFGLAIGSVIGISLSNLLLARLGARWSMTTSVAVIGLGMLVLAAGLSVLPIWAVAFSGLIVMGLGTGSCDVVMNVDGAALERALGRTTLPLLHAGFSLGAVLGAAVGALFAASPAPVAVHLVVAMVAVVGSWAAVLRWIPLGAVAEPPAPDAAPAPQRSIRERFAIWDVQLVLIGLVMLGMSFAEGGAGDWIAVAGTTGHGVSEATAAAMLATFMVLMTLGRVLSGPVVDRVGRVLAIRVTAVIGAAGLALFILAPEPWVAFAGAALWGTGCCLGFPLGMSAAADVEQNAPQRVAAVAMIGYLAFLAGPPVLGLIGEHIGILNALWVLFGLILISLLAAPATREHRGRHARTPAPTTDPADAAGLTASAPSQNGPA